MAARIILVRHGPSSHIDTAGLIDRAGVARWLDTYDSAGIQAGSHPPEALLQTAADATHIVASDLRRAVGSAEELAPGRPVHVSEVLREVSLVIPQWPTRLPLRAWGLLMHLGWKYRIARGTDLSEPQRARAAAAAELVGGLVADGSTALVVTHALFRELLANQLLGRGWTGAGRVGGYRPWSAWSFSGPGGD